MLSSMQGYLGCPASRLLLLFPAFPAACSRCLILLHVQGMWARKRHPPCCTTSKPTVCAAEPHTSGCSPLHESFVGAPLLYCGLCALRRGFRLLCVKLCVLVLVLPLPSCHVCVPSSTQPQFCHLRVVLLVLCATSLPLVLCTSPGHAGSLHCIKQQH